MAEQYPIARLTEREKQCLRLWLDRSTAKQIALELGVSHHAVEKRLKVARTKLGVSSSLDAARMLADAEGYKLAGPRPPDLADGSRPHHDTESSASPALEAARGFPRRFSITVSGVLAMAVFIATLVMLSSPFGAPSEIPPQQSVAAAAGTVSQVERGTGGVRSVNGALADADMVPASPERVREFLTSSFRFMDADGSGFIERHEAPEAGLGLATPMSNAEEGKAEIWVGGRQGQTMWIARGDENADGKVSLAEYVAAYFPTFAQSGVPASWRPAER